MRPAGRLDQAIDAAQQRALARAAQADQHQELAIAHFERDVVQARGRAWIVFDEVLDDEHGALSTLGSYELSLAWAARSAVRGRG